MSNFWGAYQRLYSFSKIFFCSPIQAAECRRSYESIKAKGEIIANICDRISDVYFIDTFKCGICGIYEKYEQNGRDLIDGLHPNENGAKKNSRIQCTGNKTVFIIKITLDKANQDIYNIICDNWGEICDFRFKKGFYN